MLLISVIRLRRRTGLLKDWAWLPIWWMGKTNQPESWFRQFSPAVMLLPLKIVRHWVGKQNLSGINKHTSHEGTVGRVGEGPAFCLSSWNFFDLAIRKEVPALSSTQTSPILSWSWTWGTGYRKQKYGSRNEIPLPHKGGTKMSFPSAEAKKIRTGTERYITLVPVPATQERCWC